MGPRKKPDLLVREVRNRHLVLYDPGNDQSYLLDPIAAVIWESCDGTRSARDIAEMISNSYQAPLARVEQDVRTTLTRLRNDGLLAADERDR